MKDYEKLIVQGWPYEKLCKISYLSIPWNFSLLEFILKNSMSKNKEIPEISQRFSSFIHNFFCSLEKKLKILAHIQII